jgi:DNA-binding XRE family transcriptional regulator
VPARSDDKRWNSGFARFVDSYGVALLASRLHVSSGAIYQWVRGATHPRLSHAREIQMLAKRRHVALSLEEIFHEVRLERGRTSSRKPESACV